MLRMPYSITIDLQTAFALQKLVKAGDGNETVLSHGNRVDVFPLKLKILQALLRLLDGGEGDVKVPLTEGEAWHLDRVLSADMGTWARDLVVQVARVLWEYDVGVGMLEALQDPPVTREDVQRAVDVWKKEEGEG